MENKLTTTLEILVSAVLELVGIILLNIGLNLYLSQVPVNLWADFILWAGIVLISVRIKLSLTK